MRRAVTKVGLAVVALDLLWLMAYAWTVGANWTPPPDVVVLEQAFIEDGTTVRAVGGELEVVGDGGFGQSRTSPVPGYMGLGFHVVLVGVAAAACGLLLRQPSPAEPVA